MPTIRESWTIVATVADPTLYAISIAALVVLGGIAMFVFSGNADLIQTVLERMIFVGVGGLGGAGLAVLRSRRND